MLGLEEKKPSQVILEKIQNLMNSINEIKGLAERQGTLQSSSSPEVGPVTCPGCKALINLNEFPGHYADEYARLHPPQIVEKPVEKMVEKPTPMTPNTLPAVFDHILNCEQGKCEWVEQFKTEAAKKGLEKIGFVERGKEGAKSPEEQGPAPLI